MTNKQIDIILGIIAALAILTLIYKVYSNQEQRKDFLLHGQYEPVYMLYNNDEMLIKCEEYDLIYNYESTLCENKIIQLPIIKGK